MYTIEDLIGRINNSSFFNQMNGEVTGLIGKNFFIPNLETAFIEPNLEMEKNGFGKAEWLPSSPLDEDPFYGKRLFNQELQKQRKIVTKTISEVFKKLDISIFLIENNDFTKFAKNSMSFAFRQYILESNLGLGNEWDNIITLYFDGHWPIAFDKDKIFTL